MKTPPTNFPSQPWLKKNFGIYLPLVEWAGMLDSFISYICGNVAGQPVKLDGKKADGTMQTWPHNLRMGHEPSLVIVNVTKPPVYPKLVGMTDVAAPYEVTMGNHDDTNVRVKINFPTGANAPEYEIIVFPPV